jgi:glycosyltransferase involved in cell wall biosynthesis
MRILIVTPTTFPTVTGNAVTVERWRQSLTQKHCSVEVFAAEGGDVSKLLDHLNAFRPEILHVLHAFRAGSLLLDDRIARRVRDIPIVVSPGGTDINLDVEMDDRREVLAATFTRARLIVLQSKEMAMRLLEFFPGVRDRIMEVPKGFSWLGDEPYDLRGILGSQPRNILFLLPAGIRPVKGNLECLSAMEEVYRARPAVQIVFAGPVLDPDYAADFKTRIHSLSAFAGWVPSIRPQAMRYAYSGADVILNTSFAEGLSNALLEAIAAGKPVLASDIPGNHWPVLGENAVERAGLLFDPNDSKDFAQKALRLIDNGGLRENLGRAGLERALRELDPVKEAEGLIAAYEAALGLKDGKELPCSKRVEPSSDMRGCRPGEETYQRLHLCDYLRDLPDPAEDQPEDPEKEQEDAEVRKLRPS